MPYALLMWKPAADAELSMTEEIVAAIGDDEAHPGMMLFDVDAVEKSIQEAFEKSPAAISCDIANYPGYAANWIIFDIEADDLKSVAPDMYGIADRHGLVVCDPQRDVVFNFQGSSKEDKVDAE